MPFITCLVLLLYNYLLHSSWQLTSFRLPFLKYHIFFFVSLSFINRCCKIIKLFSIADLIRIFFCTISSSEPIVHSSFCLIQSILYCLDNAL